VPMDFGRLQVERVIVHDIPARFVRGGGEEPRYSQVDSRLNQEIRNYFREKISGTLHAASFDVNFDPASPSPVPALVLDNLGPNLEGFVSMSQAVGRHLHESQTGATSSGLLCVIQALLAADRALAILKLEREAGMRLEQTQVEGQQTFNLEHLRELMLTTNTRVFKVGLFVQSGQELATIEGAVSDNQRGYDSGTEVADFFLRRFLGCLLKEEPDVLTKKVFQASEQFIHDHVPEAETKARYEMALIAELSSQEASFNPRAFADRHLQVDDRQAYIQTLAANGVPARLMDKDTSLIATHLRRIQVEFESDIAVLGKPQAFEDHVRMTRLDDGRTRVEIEDRIRRIQGK
jgi:hypothetical protein